MKYRSWKNKKLQKHKFVRHANKTKTVNTGVVTRRGGFRL